MKSSVVWLWRSQCGLDGPEVVDEDHEHHGQCPEHVDGEVPPSVFPGAVHYLSGTRGTVPGMLSSGGAPWR